MDQWCGTDSDTLVPMRNLTKASHTRREQGRVRCRVANHDGSTGTTWCPRCISDPVTAATSCPWPRQPNAWMAIFEPEPCVTEVVLGATSRRSAEPSVRTSGGCTGLSWRPRSSERFPERPRVVETRLPVADGCQTSCGLVEVSDSNCPEPAASPLSGTSASAGTSSAWANRPMKIVTLVAPNSLSTNQCRSRRVPSCEKQPLHNCR